MTTARALAAILATIVLAGCGSDEPAPLSEAERELYRTEAAEALGVDPSEVAIDEYGDIARGESEPADDTAAAQLACRHFRNIAGDWSILSYDEQRAKLAEVYDNARISSDPEIRQYGRAMLEHITVFDDAALAAAVEGFAAACERHADL